MNWIRFDKHLPPEDTTVMVSNGPAMGHFHYTQEAFFCGQGYDGKPVIIPLWTLDGKRADVPLSSVIQWAHMLPVPAREIKLTRWQNIKSWLRRNLNW
jgi:hypothetical protein